MMNKGKILVILWLGVLLAGCGGGGASTTTTTVNAGSTTNIPTVAVDAGKAYTGNRNLAQLDGNNSVDFVRLILGSANLDSILSARPEQMPTSADNGSLYQVQQMLVRLAANPLASNRYQAKAVAETEPCPNGGSATTSGNLNDLTHTGSLQLTYSQCRQDNILLDGAAVMAVHSFNTSLGQPVAFTLSMNNFEVSLNSVPYRMTGTLRSDLNTATGQTTLTENLLRRNLATGKQELAENVRLLQTANGMAAFSGKFCDSQQGCISVVSTKDFLFWINGLPAEGDMLITGASGSSLQFITVYTSSFQFKLDTNGDGVYEIDFYRDNDNLLTDDSQDNNSKPNSPPLIVFTADPNRSITLGGTLPLDARQSFDPEYSRLHYQWTLLSAPTGSIARIANQQSALATLTPDKEGTYQINLKVSDPQGLDSQTTITLKAWGRAQSLPYNILDAEYSDSLERLVAVSSQPSNALKILATDTGLSTSVPLALAPTSVAVSPDGKTAVVGHDGAVTYVNLENANIIRFVDGIGFKVFDVVLGKQSIAYASNANKSGMLVAINFTNGQIQMDTTAIGLGAAHLQQAPALNALYAMTTGVFPTDLNRVDIGNAAPQWRYDSPYHGDYEMRENLWITEDGASILTAGGSLFQTATQQSQDMRYQRTLPDVSQSQSGIYHEVLHADHSQEVAKFVVASFEHSFYTSGGLGAVSLNVYTTPLLNLESSLSLNGLTLDGGGEAVMPQFVFFNSNGTKRYAILTQGTGTYLLPF